MSEHKLITLDDIAEMAATGHSVFSPSGSKMWLTCSGSLIPNLLAEDHGSREAAEGTVAHSVAERWLTTGKRPRHLIGTTEECDGWPIEIDDEMLAYVGDYVAWCQEIEDDCVEFLVETRVDISDLTPIPNQGGTSDCIGLMKKESGKYKLFVRDLKYGKGVRVVAEDNTQGLIYAYGSWKILRDRYDIDEIEIGICHPRLTDGTTTFTVTIDALRTFASYVKERAAEAWQFDAPRTPSDAGCQWCKVKGTCPALYQHLAEVTSGAFDDDDEFVRYDGEQMDDATEELEDDLGGPAFRPINPRRLSTRALAKILRYRGVMEQLFSAIEAELLDRALSREEEIPGWKIVRGRTIRKWPDDEIAVYSKLKRLGLKDGAIYEQSIISPAEAEKRLHAKAGLSKDAAAKLVNSLAVKPPGKKSLARASDKREALASDADAFEDDDPFERA
jgi:hypothetical protein